MLSLIVISCEMRDPQPPNADRSFRRMTNHEGRKIKSKELFAATYPSFASIVIFAFSTFDTGHPAFAFCAAVLKASSLAPGTLATTSRCTAVIAHPSSSFSMVSVAGVFMLSRFSFARPGEGDSAVEKHAACADEINSSGFVPGPYSNRVAKEYFVFER